MTLPQCPPSSSTVFSSSPPIRLDQTTITAGGATVTLAPICGCTGVRFCKLCANSERVLRLKKNTEICDKYSDYRCYYYDIDLQYAILDDRLSCSSSFVDIRQKISQQTPTSAERLALPGLRLICDFVSDEEEKYLVEKIDRAPWKLSQSGRRKQDYGPKVNFKQQKVKTEVFEGIPDYADQLIDKIRGIFAITKDEDGGGGWGPGKAFEPIELCNLEYLASRNSAIEMHKDDCWIWGERLISVNLLGDTVISLENEAQKHLVFVFLPRRSILVMYDVVRYEYMHGIFASHVVDRRLAITVREAADSFKVGGENYERYGRELAERAKWRIIT